ncbi:unnamed protein product [Rhizopus stolonifer]
MEKIKLNVGGKVFHTLKETLKRSPFFNTLLEGDMQGHAMTEEGEIIVDKNGTLFEYVLSYLRTRNLDWISDKTLLQRLNVEADFYGLSDMKDAINVKLNTPKIVYEVMSLENFRDKTRLHVYKNGKNQWIHPTHFENYEIVSIIDHLEETWICPRHIFSHDEQYRCGKKCNSALDPEKHGKQYVDKTSVLVVYKQLP